MFLEKCKLLFIFSSVALVNFKPTIYMTTEGGVVMVIAMVDKDIEKETMVTVRIVNGTAMGLCNLGNKCCCTMLLPVSLGLSRRC